MDGKPVRTFLFSFSGHPAAYRFPKPGIRSEPQLGSHFTGPGINLASWCYINTTNLVVSHWKLQSKLFNLTKGHQKSSRLTLELFQTYQCLFYIEIFLISFFSYWCLCYFLLCEFSISPNSSPDDLTQLFPHKHTMFDKESI